MDMDDVSVGWGWKNIVRAAKKVGNVATDSRVLKAVAPLVASAIPGGGLAYHAAMQVNDIVSKAREQNPEAVKAIAAIRAVAGKGDPKAREVEKLMQSMSQKLDDKMRQLAAATASATPQASPAATVTQAAQAPTMALAPSPKSGGGGVMIGVAVAAGLGLLLIASRK